VNLRIKGGFEQSPQTSSLLQLPERTRPAVGCLAILWSGFKFALNASRYKAQ
jgi:hypothetical protein